MTTRPALLLALLAWASFTVARADEPELTSRSGDLISVFGGEIHVPSHVRQLGQVVSIGGRVRIEGEVSEDVVVVAGRLEISGRVDGQVVAVLSEQKLETARIEGDFASVLGSLELRETTIDGEFVNILSRLAQDNLSTPPIVNLGAWIPELMALVFWLRLARLLVIFLLLVLLVALAPERVRLIGEEVPLRYVSALFTGVLGYLAVLAIWALMTASVVGIPFFFLVYWLTKWLAIAGLFYAVGRRLGRSWGRELSLLGAVLVTFAIYTLLTLAPTPLGLWGLPVSVLLWAVFWLTVELPAIGLLILTRLGTRGSGPHQPPAPSASP